MDVPGPVLRHAPAMSEYKAAHIRCMNWLSVAWGIEQTAWALVKAADYSILGAESAVRPVPTDGTVGGGEGLTPWPSLRLAGDHNLRLRGEEFVEKAWSSAYHALRGAQ